MEIFFRWVVGVVFTFALGRWLTPRIVRKLRTRYIIEKLERISEGKAEEEKESLKRIYGISAEKALKEARDYDSPRQPIEISANVTGFIEQLFFLIIVAFNIQGAAVAMVVWATVKMATGWNYPQEPRRTSPVFRLFALSALLGTIVSLLFATVGGLICRGCIWWRQGTPTIYHCITFVIALVFGLFYVADIWWQSNQEKSREFSRTTSSS